MVSVQRRSRQDNRMRLDEQDARELLASLQTSASANLPLPAHDVARLLSCSPPALGKFAVTSPSSTAGRSPQGEPPQQFLRDVVVVMSDMSELSGSVAGSADWLLHSSIAELDGLTPIEAIAAGKGSRLRNLIEMYDAGPAG